MPRIKGWYMCKHRIKKLIYNNLVDKYKSFILKELSDNKRIGAFYTEYEVIDKADFIFTDSFLKYY